MQAEAERRLGQAKRAAPAGRPRPSPAKRSRPTAVSSDEELSEQEGSDGDGNADMVRFWSFHDTSQSGLVALHHGLCIANVRTSVSGIVLCV